MGLLSLTRTIRSAIRDSAQTPSPSTTSALGYIISRMRHRVNATALWAQTPAGNWLRVAARPSTSGFEIFYCRIYSADITARGTPPKNRVGPFGGLLGDAFGSASSSSIANGRRHVALADRWQTGLRLHTEARRGVETWNPPVQSGIVGDAPPSASALRAMLASHGDECSTTTEGFTLKLEYLA